MTLLYGGLRKKASCEIIQQLKESPDNISRIIAAIGSYISKKFDEPRMDNLLITMHSSFKGKIVQYAGRLSRYYRDKKGSHNL